MILPVDKGKAVVVKDSKEYITQCEKLLGHQATYTNKGTNNPTKTQKGRIQHKLRDLKKAGHLDKSTYNNIYLTSDTTPRFYATSKIHKDPLKMKPIVSGIRSITYSLVRYLADLLKPLVGKTKRHIQNSKDLVDKLQEIVIIEEGEVINSFDITALFTSVLGNEVVQMVIESTTSDPTWNERTLLTPEEFSDLETRIHDVAPHPSNN